VEKEKNSYTAGLVVRKPIRKLARELAATKHTKAVGGSAFTRERNHKKILLLK